jgi:uncharacterized membrane protein
MGETKETARVEAFSDGVIAIAITLLVIELKVPHVDDHGPGLFAALAGQWNQYLAYLVSFWSIGLAWVIHHTLFNYIRRTTHTLLLLNLLFLLCVAIVPYPTAIVAEYLQIRGEQSTAVMVFSALWLLLAIALNVLWWYATSRGLVDARVAPSDVAAMTRRLVFGPPLYLLALLLALVSFEAAVAVYLLIGVLYTAPRWGRAAPAPSG